jgi:uncharacterized phage infection (PIP) family protein YhgE
MEMKKNIKIMVAMLAGISIPVAGTAQQQQGQPAGVPPAAAGQQQQAQAKMQEIEQEFREISTKLQQVEQKAVAQKEVASARQQFDSLLEKEILRKDPELKEAVELRGKYAEYMDDVKAGKGLPDGMEINEVYTEYNSVHQKIMPVEQQVMRDEKVQDAYSRFQQTLVSHMREIEPKVMDYLSRQQELRDEYQKLLRSVQGS